MKMRIRTIFLACFPACFLLSVPVMHLPAQELADSGSKPVAKVPPMPRTPAGKPDFQGLWEVRPPGGNAAYDVEDHLKQVYGIPPGKGVIVDPKDGKIPYLPAAAQRKQDLVEHHMYEDPEAHCFLSGVPRQVYAPFGFTILQPAGYTLMLFENFHAYRVIPMDGRPHLPPDIKLYDGDSRGSWDGDTLVVDVTNQNDKTWFDMAGNFHSDAIHVVERYTPADANTINYQATIDDPKTFSRPWTIAFPITRITRPGYEMMELACVEGERDLKHYTEKEGGKK
jgi:hypothetical protein